MVWDSEDADEVETPRRHVKRTNLQQDTVSDSSHNDHGSSFLNRDSLDTSVDTRCSVVGGDISAAKEGESGLVCPVILFCNWASARGTKQKRSMSTLVRLANPVFPQGASSEGRPGRRKAIVSEIWYYKPRSWHYGGVTFGINDRASCSRPIMVSVAYGSHNFQNVSRLATRQGHVLVLRLNICLGRVLETINVTSDMIQTRSGRESGA